MIRRFRDLWLRVCVEANMPPKRQDEFARINVTHWKEMAPGTVNVVAAPDGHKWAVMHLEDFDHLCVVAKLQRAQLTEIVSTEPWK